MKIFHWPAIIIAISCAINAPAIADHKHGAGVVPCGEGCDKDTEFFDRQTKQCIPKSSMNRISQEALKACWRCPTDIQKDCVMEMNKPEHQRGYAATDWAGIQKRCHIE